jgi:hypothetical protein
MRGYRVGCTWFGLRVFERSVKVHAVGTGSVFGISSELKPI